MAALRSTDLYSNPRSLPAVHPKRHESLNSRFHGMVLTHRNDPRAADQRRGRGAGSGAGRARMSSSAQGRARMSEVAATLSHPLPPTAVAWCTGRDPLPAPHSRRNRAAPVASAAIVNGRILTATGRCSRRSTPRSAAPSPPTPPAPKGKVTQTATSHQICAARFQVPAEPARARPWGEELLICG